MTLGQTFSLTLTAEDPNDDELTFDVPNLPPGASFTSSGNQLNFVWLVDSAEPVCIYKPSTCNIYRMAKTKIVITVK